MLPMLLENRKSLDESSVESTIERAVENEKDNTKADLKEYAGSREYSLLFASILRCKGNPVRVRAGFIPSNAADQNDQSYIKEQRFTDHWITELYLLKEKRWIRIDPDRMLYELKDNGFIDSGTMFLYLQDGKIEAAAVGGRAAEGWKAAAAALLCDFYSLVHDELWYLPDTPLFKKLDTDSADSYQVLTAGLSEQEKKVLDRIALLLARPDENMNELTALYRENKLFFQG